MNKQNMPRVGVGCYVFNEKGQFLLGLRKSKHGEGTWCPPGGHLELGETPAEAAIREAQEETGIELKNIRELAVTNDIYSPEKHYVTFHMYTEYKSGTLTLMEPEKCVEWRWFDLDKLPQPLFLSLQIYLDKYGNKF